jgi:hypothetical protein
MSKHHGEADGIADQRDLGSEHGASEEESAAAEEARSAPDARAQRRAEARGRRQGRGAQPPEPHKPEKRPFEFKAEHNPSFARLGMLMQVVGLIGLAMTLLAAAWFFIAVIGLPSFSLVLLLYLVPVAVPAAVGVWTMRAGQRFSLIAKTEGSDVGHLMAAIGELTKLYLLQVVGFALGITAAVVAMVLGAGLLLR